MPRHLIKPPPFRKSAAPVRLWFAATGCLGLHLPHLDTSPSTLPRPDPIAPAPAIALAGVERVFDGGVRALSPVSIEAPRGQFLALLGPSGCGKSTLLRIIAGLDRPTAGRVHLAGDPRIAFVFQEPNLLPWRTLLHNVALPLELNGVVRRDRIERARRVIAQVGLTDAETRYPQQLSGGMKMRASLARALVTDPQLLLLDEPFAALDEITRQALDDELRALWRSRGMTVVFVTHSIDEATYLGERAIMLSRRPGRVVLDRAIDLPAERDAAIRVTPEFARQARVLFEALQAQEAHR